MHYLLRPLAGAVDDDEAPVQVLVDGHEDVLLVEEVAALGPALDRQVGVGQLR